MNLTRALRSSRRVGLPSSASARFWSLLSPSCVASRQYSRPSIAPKPVLDIKHITKNPGLYEQNCVDRNYRQQAQNSWRILELTQERATLQRAAREQRELNNDVQRQIGELQRRIKTPAEPTERQDLEGSLIELLSKAKVIKDAVSGVAEQEKQIDDEILELALALPNLSSQATPSGDGAEVVSFNEPSVEGLEYLSNPERCMNQEAMSHVDIAARMDIIDFAGAATSSGWGYYFLKNQGLMLEQALIQYALSILRRHGFTVTSAPSIVYSHIAAACGFQPRDQNDEQQIFNIQQSEKDQNKPGLSLAATAEIPLAGMYAGHTFAESDLPLRMGAVSRCYRAEAGARGVDTKGLYRVHEFTKVEMFAWTMPQIEGEDMFSTEYEAPQTSDKVFEQMLEIQQEILEDLGLTYRILEMPSTDLGGPATRKRDIEVYFPSRQDKDGGWGEVTSTSICTDYQSRRLGARVKSSSEGKLLYPYTVNGTALAVPRILAAILETHYDTQTQEFAVPAALDPWMIGYDEQTSA